MRFLVWSLCLALAAPAARAQTPAAPAVQAQDPQAAQTALTPPLRAMTLDEALAYASVHQPSLLAARARLEAAKSDTGLASGLWLPKLGVSVQALGGTANNSSASYFGSAVVDIPRVGGTKSAPPSSWSPEASTFAGVGVRQELFDFGRIRALSVIYDSAEDEQSARADAARLDVAAMVEESFYGVRAAKAVLDAAQAAEKRVQLHRDQANAGVKSGLRSPIELTRADADLARFQVGTLRSAGGLEVARVVFASAVGVPDRELDVAGADPAVAPGPDLSHLDALADRDPSVRAARARLFEQQGTTRQARAELLPELYASGGLNGRAGGTQPSNGTVPSGNGWLPDVPNWDVGVILSWPIFDATSLARVSASQAREQARAAEEQQARLEFSAAAQQANELLRVATVTLPALQRAADAAAANYAQADARFGAGLGNAVELADAEALRLQADIDLAVGRFDQARARARLGRVIAEGL